MLTFWKFKEKVLAKFKTAVVVSVTGEEVNFQLADHCVGGFALMRRKDPCLKLSEYLAEAVLLPDDEEDSAQSCVDATDFDTLYDTDMEERKAVVMLGRAARQRCTPQKQLLAMAMSRLSAESPARVLTKDCLRVIYYWLVNIQKLLVLGGCRKVQSAEGRVDLVADLSVWMLGLANFNWARLPDLPCPLKGAAAVVWKNQLILVGGETLGADGSWTSLTSWCMILEGGEWTRVKLLKGKKRAPRRFCSAVVYHDHMYVLGGREINDWTGGVGSPDVCVSLEGKVIVEFHSRPEFQRFSATKSFLVGSFLVCFAVAPRCLNLTPDKSNSYQTPESPSTCCNQLMFINLDNPQEGWHELPWLSHSHVTHSISLFLRGTKLHMENGARTVVGCPCCGTMAFTQPNHYYMDLAELPAVPYWRYWRDEEPFIAGSCEGLIENEVVVECSRGLLRLGGENCAVDKEFLRDVVLQEGGQESRVVSRFGDDDGDLPAPREGFAHVLL